MDQQDSANDTRNSRTITSILVKTLLVHVFALVNYGHLSSVLRIPTKHNAHIFRVIVFLFFPTIAVAPVLIDALQVLLRFLQTPDETSPAALNFYLHGIIGVRATTQNHDDEDKNTESTRLLQLGDVEFTRHEKTPWTWKRVGRICATVLVMAQGAGTIALWARRVQMDALLSLDNRNFYMACGSVVSSILSLLLLILGNKWTYEPETHGHLTLPRWPETRRLLVEIIIAGLIQEAPSRFAGDDIPKYATTIWVVAPHTPLEWVLYGVLILSVILFRKDIEAKLGLKLLPIGLFLLGIACGWVIVDAISLIVVDIIGLVNFQPEPVRRWYRHDVGWSDPLEELIPVI